MLSKYTTNLVVIIKTKIRSDKDSILACSLRGENNRIHHFTRILRNSFQEASNLLRGLQLRQGE